MKGLNPQQMKFKEGYLNPNSPTFGNAKASAIAAGYAEDYADHITAQGQDWIGGIMRDFQRLTKAEKVLDEVLEMPVDDVNVLKVKTDVAKFVARGMAKEKYSERNEHTGADGGDLLIKVVKYDGDNDPV